MLEQCEEAGERVAWRGRLGYQGWGSHCKEFGFCPEDIGLSSFLGTFLAGVWHNKNVFERQL